MNRPFPPSSNARRSLLLAALAASALPLSGRAGIYPSRPITLVVPFPAGGSVDLIGRIYADALGKALGTTVIVEHREGAGGAIGSQRVARAAPDGYTLVASSQSSHLANPLMREKLGYDPIKDFVSISQLAQLPNALITHPEVPAQDLTQFIALLTARPNDLHYASGGVGSMGHLNVEMLKSVLNARAVHVPYRGGASLLNGLLSNQVQFVLDNLAPFLPYIHSGHLRALSVAAPVRLAILPDVPTFSELGYSGLNAMSWIGLAAPAGTPGAVVQTLSEAVQKVAIGDSVPNSLAKVGVLVPEQHSPQEFTAMMLESLAFYRDVIQRAGIRLE